VTLWGEMTNRSFSNYPLTYNDAREFARRTRALEKMAVFAYEAATPQDIQEGNQVFNLSRALVSGNYFDVLDVRPSLGRSLRVDDDVRGAAPVAVLSHSAWQQRFSGDREVVGRKILMHGTGIAYTIVGVMPQGLDYPRGTDFWSPLVPEKTAPGSDSTLAHVDLIGRLRSAASAVNARDELSAFFVRPESAQWEHGLRGVVHTLPSLILGDTKPALFVFAAASALLLLITCINVANLLLVRGLARTRELAVRSALGAERSQVVAQLLTENGLLAIAGGLSGLLLTMIAIRVFVAFAPRDVPRLDEIHLSATVLLAAVAITAIAMLVFALAPAVLASRVQLHQLLRSDARQSASRRSRFGTEVLVAAQIALALLVLSGAGLIARSLINLERVELSFESSGLLVGSLALRYGVYDTPAKQIDLLDRLVLQLKGTPGVRAATPVVAVPFSGSWGWDGRLAAEGQSAEQATANPVLNMELVAPAYFTTFEIPLLRGRGFSEADRAGAPPVIVVSQSTARHFWPGKDPLGKRMTVAGSLKQVLIVVGVVPDTRYRDLRTARPSIYFPLRQSVFPYAPLNLAIRTVGPPAAMVPAVRRAIAQVDPHVALAKVAEFETYLDGPLAQPRLNAILLLVFAAAAVVLAAVGLFGVMATTVRQRTRELGIRMALGATARDLRRMVMGRGLAIAAVGTAAGLLGASAANRLLVSMLFEVSPMDRLTLVLVAAFLLGVAVIASFIPARSSTQIDPVVALRADV
jgi:putative ABC transport system permease protein